MKIPRQPLLAAFAALTLPFITCATKAESPSSDTVYVTIENFDPIRFDRMRYSLMTGDELILATLKGSAAEQAHFAGYPGTVIVLDENAKPPAGATVLTLTWNGNAVAADVNQAGKGKYLGIVNRLPLSYHPDFKRLQQSIDTAGVPDARRDAALRAEVQMNLFLALQYLVRYQKDLSAQH
jgi:hypothetical protein